MLQRPHDPWKRVGRRESSEGIATLFAVNCIVALVLLILALSSPSASEWISAAAQAEFVGPDTSTVPPTLIAQPAGQTRTVRSN